MIKFIIEIKYSKVTNYFLPRAQKPFNGDSICLNKIVVERHCLFIHNPSCFCLHYLNTLFFLYDVCTFSSPMKSTVKLKHRYLEKRLTGILPGAEIEDKGAPWIREDKSHCELHWA